jgi:hypothetical protein
MAEVQTRDILLRIGGRTLQRFGVLACNGAGRAIPGLVETFTRADASTCATYLDRDGILRLAAANKVRIEWVDLDGDGIRETPGILLEGIRVNSLLQSETFDNATWQKTRASISANAITAPDGTLTADKLVEDATAASTHFVAQSLTITADENVADAIFLRAAERTKAQIYLTNGAGSEGARVDVDLSAGTLSGAVARGSGSLYVSSITKLADGWYRVGLGGKIASGITSGWIIVQLANAGGNVSYDGDGTSGLYVWGAQFERGAAFPSSYIKTVASAVTRAADSLTVPFNFGPMDLTVLARLARPVHADAAGTLTTGSNLHIYELSSANPKLSGYFASIARQLLARITTATGSIAPVLAIPAGAQLTVCEQFRALTTGGFARLDVGGGFGTDTGPAPSFAAFGDQTLHIGGTGAAGGELYGVLLDVIVFRGLFSLAECLAVP